MAVQDSSYSPQDLMRSRVQNEQKIVLGSMICYDLITAPLFTNDRGLRKKDRRIDQ